MELQDLTHDVWEGLLGETFVVRFDDGSTIDLVLAEATRPPGDPERNGHAHSAVFHGPRDTFMPQMIRHISHEGIGGEQGIFLVPVGETDTAYEYEAVFTHTPVSPPPADG